MKTRLLLSLALWVLSSALAGATVIVDDTWADGNRTNTSLPTESAWFASSASSLTNYAAGSMTGLCDPANSRTWLTYFTTNPAVPVDVAVGETLKVTLVFIPTNVAEFVSGNLRGLRMGLFNFADGGTRASTDGSFVGSSTGSGTNVWGFLLNQSFYTVFPVDAPMELWARTTLESGNLMGTLGYYLQVGASGPAGYLNAAGFVSGTQYTLEFSVARTAANSHDVSARITGGGLDLFNSATDTNYFYNRFDCFAIRCDKSTNTAASFTFSEFKVELMSPAAPSVTTLPATNVINDVATLNGTVTPHDLPTMAWFEWGTVPTYWQQTAPVSVGAEGTAIPLSNTLTGLTAGVLYHCRAVASNSLGLVRGDEVRFWAPNVIVIGSNPLTNECHTPLSQTAKRFAIGPAYASIAAGGGHCLGLRADGAVVGWGYNNYGQTIIPAIATNVAAIAAGSAHSLALRADGTVVGWGYNYFGQATGVPNIVSPQSSVGVVMVAGQLTNAVAIAAGGSHSLALRADGTVVGWGNNYSGQTNIPASATNVVAIAAGSAHSLALKADGTIVGWGNNDFDQTNSPPSASNVVAIAAGGLHSLALRADGTVVGWGNNDYDQTNIPPSASNVVAIAAGYRHSLALRADGTVVGWGSETNIPAGATNVVAIAAGWSYSLALKADGTIVGWGGYSNTSTPASATNVVALAAGGGHSLALRGGGFVFGWGYNCYGQIIVPPSAANVVAIAAGGYHSLALCADGTVVSWGSTDFDLIPIPASATNVVAIAAGDRHSLALRGDGTVVGWGSTNYGQTTIPPSATNVVAIAAGGYHSLALKADGTVVGWGADYYGQSTPPAWLANLGLSIVTSSTVDPNVPGLYEIACSATTADGAVGSATRAVWVMDTIPPTLGLAGANPFVQRQGTSFIDPGATATDLCAGDLTGSVYVSGTVNTTVLGLYTLTYTVTDPNGNSATNNRTVIVAAVPSVSSLSATPAGTNALSGSPQVRISAGVNPNGLPSQSFFDYGLSTAYPGRITQTNLPAGFIAITVAADIPLGLVPGATYHWRAVASNELGVTYSSDQTFTAPLVFAVGDANGDGVVDQGELSLVLSNYWPTSPWLYLTNVAGLGGTNVTFALSNSTAGAYSVLMSTNLADWEYLGPATPRFEFTDTNAPAMPQRFYRLRWP